MSLYIKDSSMIGDSSAACNDQAPDLDAEQTNALWSRHRHRVASGNCILTLAESKKEITPKFYDPHDADDPVTVRYQSYFIHGLATATDKRVSDALAGRPLAIFRAYGPSLQLDEALYDWSLSFGINFNFVVAAARRTLQRWSRQPKLLEKKSWALTTIIGGAIWDARPDIELNALAIELRSSQKLTPSQWDQIEIKVEDMIENLTRLACSPHPFSGRAHNTLPVLMVARRQIVQRSANIAAEALGRAALMIRGTTEGPLLPTPRKHQRNTRDQYISIKWLVMQHVFGYSSRKIAQSEDLSNHPAITRQIKWAAKQLGITPSKPLAGRPKGAKTQFKRGLEVL